MYEDALVAIDAAGTVAGRSDGDDVKYDDRDGDTGGGSNAAGVRPGSQTPQQLRRTCVAGVARCVLRLGDLRRGVRLARETDSPQLCRECAAILEEMRQPAEAAAMFELGGQFDRAAAIYVAARDLAQATAVMPRVTLPKLLAQYARACEAAEQWQAAADAYERARDMDAVVRLRLDRLGEPERAFATVRATASATGAELVSRYCQDMGDWRGAIEFLLMARRSDDALALAKEHGQVEVFAAALGDAISPEEALAVARHFESQREPGRAGRFYALCGQHHRALKLFLQCGDAEVAAAIAVVGKARSDMLTHTLIDFLMGETDGVPKDPNYIYRLYMALGNFAQAGKTAVIIAQQEQELGNYRQAHAILHETIRELENQGARVPQVLRKSFVLLHSYVVAKQLARRGDHEGAARMLLRVANSISRFPSHTVPILTSAVIECQRAGLKDSAFQFASVLMRSEHRGNIDKKYRRSVESIVRRPSREEAAEGLSPCPISGDLIKHTELECPATKDPLPMCVVTGRHMLRDDWCVCPRSRMPALHSEYLRYLRHAAAVAAAAGSGNGNGNGNSNDNGAGNGDGGDGGDGDGDPSGGDDGNGDDDSTANGSRRSGGGGGGGAVRGGRRRSSGTAGCGGLGLEAARVCSGPDPVLGLPVSSGELSRCSNAEVDEYLRQFVNGGDGEEGEAGAAAGADAVAAAAVNGTARTPTTARMLQQGG
ncbi:unnamed protein product [Phaeothamnion confervicola]